MAKQSSLWFLTKPRLLWLFIIKKKKSTNIESSSHVHQAYIYGKPGSHSLATISFGT